MWQEILVVLNTVDTALGAVFLIFSCLGFRTWWRERREKGRTGAMGAPGSEEAPPDATARPHDR